MNDGLASHIVADKLSFITSEIPNDIVTLYEWKNGTNEHAQYDDTLFLDGYFLNIDSSIDLYKTEPKSEWFGDFFPLFMGYGGVLILIGVVIINKARIRLIKIWKKHLLTENYLKLYTEQIILIQNIGNMMIDSVRAMC